MTIWGFLAVLYLSAATLALARLPDEFFHQYRVWVKRTTRFSMEFGLGVSLSAAFLLVIFVDLDNPEHAQARFSGILMCTALLSLQLLAGMYFWLAKYKKKRQGE